MQAENQWRFAAGIGSPSFFWFYSTRESCIISLEVKFMPIKKIKASSNGTSPKAKDFANPKRLTKDEKESLDAFREAMKALKKGEAKYGKKTYL